MTIHALLPRRIRFESQLAWRHLRSGGGQTWLTISAVASGVIIVIFITSLIFGLQRRLTALLTEAIPHVTVRVPDGKPVPYGRTAGGGAGISVSSRSEMQAPQRKNIDDWRTVLAVAESIPNVRAVTPAVAGQAFASKGANPVGVSLTGSDPARQELITPVTKNLISGRYLGLAADETVIDYELAKDLLAGVGDRIRITSVSGAAEPLRIAGIYSRGQGRGSAYVTLRTGQSMLATGNSINVVYVKVIDIYGADAVAERLAALLDCEAKPWSREFPSFVTSLQAQSASAYLISGFTLAASAFAIASVLIVSVQRKSKQIGILKSIGARKNQILMVFLLEGFGIAVAGSITGAIAGVGVVYLLSLPRQVAVRVGGLPTVCQEKIRVRRFRGLAPATPGFIALRQSDGRGGRCRPYHFGPETALESHPCVALSSAQASRWYHRFAVARAGPIFAVTPLAGVWLLQTVDRTVCASAAST